MIYEINMEIYCDRVGNYIRGPVVEVELGSHGHELGGPGGRGTIQSEATGRILD